MRVPIQTIGSECVICLPNKLLVKASIEPNDILNVEIQSGKIVLSKDFHHHLLEEHVAMFGNSLQLSDEVVWAKSQ